MESKYARNSSRTKASLPSAPQRGQKRFRIYCNFDHARVSEIPERIVCIDRYTVFRATYERTPHFRFIRRTHTHTHTHTYVGLVDTRKRPPPRISAREKNCRIKGTLSEKKFGEIRNLQVVVDVRVAGTLRELDSCSPQR